MPSSSPGASRWMMSPERVRVRQDKRDGSVWGVHICIVYVRMLYGYVCVHHMMPDTR